MVACGWFFHWLFDQGADPAIQDKQGRSALECKGEAEEEAQAWDRQDSLMEVKPSMIRKEKYQTLKTKGS